MKDKLREDIENLVQSYKEQRTKLIDEQNEFEKGSLNFAADLVRYHIKYIGKSISDLEKILSNNPKARALNDNEAKGKKCDLEKTGICPISPDGEPQNCHFCDRC